MCWLHANAVGIDLGMNKPEWTFSNTSMMNAVTTKRHLDLRVWSGSLVLLADQQGPFALPAGPFEPGDRVGLGARHNSTALRVRVLGGPHPQAAVRAVDGTERPQSAATGNGEDGGLGSRQLVRPLCPGHNLFSALAI
ncbi:MAG: hypothetical protein MUE50_20730 [Pirellulaceae bacterium]|nr:hypothetical protein [Pirellulaceae bacterium]